MQYAIVNGARGEAFEGGRGECPICGAAALAKCGPRVIHHWAHSGRRDCDPWWENETPWHREWKARFPAACQEIVQFAPDGEVHRADVKTPSGIVVEVQNSPMSDVERLSREAFYGEMVWVLNGAPFKKQFAIYHGLPDPEAAVSQDLTWVRSRTPSLGTHDGMFFRPSERVEGSQLQRLHSMREIFKQVRAAYAGHHQYDWVRPRSTWLEAGKPVFIDYGGRQLLRLGSWGQQQLPCVRFVDLDAFIQESMTATSASDVGVTQGMFLS